MCSRPASSEYQFREYSSKPEGHHRYLLPPVQRLVSKFVPHGKRILDAGCGNGGLSARLAGHYDVCGFDLSESGVAAAKDQCPQGRFAVASVYDDVRPLFGVQFDAAVSLEVVEHLYDPHAYMRRLHEAVQPQGIIVISSPYHGYLKNVVLAATGKFDVHFTALQAGGHIKFWSRRTLSRLFDDCGFDVLEFAGCGRVPLLWKSMILVGRRREE